VLLEKETDRTLSHSTWNRTQLGLQESESVLVSENFMIVTWYGPRAFVFLSVFLLIYYL